MESPEPNRRWFRAAVRVIRGVVSIACLLACIGFAALWVRSYFWRDGVFYHTPGRYWGVSSWNGSVLFRTSTTNLKAYQPIWLSMTSAEKWERQARSAWGKNRHGDLERSAPHWFLVIVTGALAVALKPKPCLRFTIRDLLVAMTMVAVVVATLASLPKT